MKRTHLLAATALGFAAAMLSACGGGGGASSRPSTPATNPPPPPPSPTPPPAMLDTAEYRRSTAATSVNALTAYENGAFGAGIKVGVIDSGIDLQSPEFAGRIDAASRDVAGNRSIDDESGHGTSVTAVVAAARNASDIQGVSPGVTIIAMRTDSPGSCEDEDGCTHADSAIAAGIDGAVAAGARVINVSLGGSAAAPVLVGAIDRATRAGAIIVISAGNDGEPNPDPLALSANLSVARGRVLIAGALDAADQLAGFSNAAGSGQAHYLTTIGERVRSFDHRGIAFLYSGTSYAAPGVTGAIALLISAFPTLSADEVIEILKSSAIDLGAAGVDSTFGHGKVDLTAAFQPQGPTSLAGSTVAVDTDVPSGSVGGAAGDGGQLGNALGEVVILDRYGRAYSVDFGSSLAVRGVQRRLAARVMTAAESGAFSFGPARLTWRADGAGTGGAHLGFAQAGFDARAGGTRSLGSGFVSAVPLPGTTAAVAFGYAPADLLDSIGAGRSRPQLVTEQNLLRDEGISVAAGSSAAVETRLGAWTFGIAAGTGEADPGGAVRGGTRSDAEMFAVRGQREFGAVRLTLGYDRLRESGTFLGSRGSALLGLRGATSDFAVAEADYSAGDGWVLGLSMRGGLTRLDRQGGLTAAAETLKSAAFALRADKYDVLASGDALSLRLSQPLRIERGGLQLDVPTGYDYGTGRAEVERIEASLAPSGREVAVEAGYRALLGNGNVSANLFYRREPGHIAGNADDIGGAISLTQRF